MHSGSDDVKVIFRINDEVLPRLKHPLGQLVLGLPEKTIPILKDIIGKEIPRKVIAVGDVVSTYMQRLGLPTDLIVVDRKTTRNKAECCSYGVFSITVHNPPGQISKEAYDVLKLATRRESVRSICVYGEEDLLTLPLVALAPIGSIVIYGQPLVGLVIVRVTSSMRRDAKRILHKMRVHD